MPKFSVKRPYVILVAVVMVLVLGGVSFSKMTTDLLPNMNMPYMLVITTYPGASPEKVETELTDVIENGVGTVNGVKEVTSTSSENYSMVTLQFEDGTNMDSAMVKVTSAVNQLDLPENVDNPMVMELSMDMMATMMVSVDYKGKKGYDLTQYVQDNIIPELQRQDGVASVQASGLVEKSVEVKLNQKKIDDVNGRILEKTDSTLRDARKKIDDAQSKLDEGKAELQTQKDKLSTQQTDKSNELAKFSKMMDQAMANKEAYTSQVTSLKASQTALKTELAAYKKNKIEDSYDQINSSFGSARKSLESGDGYKAIYDQVYQQVLIAAVQNAMDQSGSKVTVSASNVNKLLGQLGSNADDIKKMAAQNAETTAKQQAEKQLAKMPEDIKDALDHPAKLKAMQDMMKQQGQAKAAKNLTKKNLRTMYDIVNTRIPQINTELANLKIKIKTAQAVLAKVEKSIKKAEGKYEQVEAGKITAAAAFGAANAQLASAQTTLDNSSKELEKARKSYEKSRKEALKKANLDQLLTQEQLANILKAENFSMPAGYISEDGTQYLIKVGDEYNNIKELKRTLLTNMKDIGDIRLCDVADVTVIDNSGDNYAKVNGNDAVILSISKSSTAGTSVVSKRCNQKIKELAGEDKNLHITNLMDQGDYIKIIINSVLSNLIYGALLAVLVLMLFLKDVRPTAVVAFSIPLSVLFAIVLMYFSNITMNIISLSGLALGVGMLVDNSIVVIENIYRLRNKGVSAARAAVMGANQVAGAIFSSTLTTICVFLPIIFTDGLTRSIMQDMCLTIAYSLSASLVVALTVVPSMSATLLKKESTGKHRFFDAVVNAYEKAARFSLSHKPVVLLTSLALLVVCVIQVFRMGIVMMPDMASEQMSITATMPKETSDEEDYKTADEIVKIAESIKGVNTVGAVKTSGTTVLMASNTKSYSFEVLLDKKYARKNKEIADKINTKMEKLNLEDYSVSASNMDMSSMLGSGLNVEISGKDNDKLLAISEDIMKIVGEIKGFTEITNEQEEGDIEYVVTVDKDEAMKCGLTVAQVYQELAAALTTEKDSTKITVNEQQYNVKIVDERDELDTKNLADYEFETTKMNDKGKKVTKTYKLSRFAKITKGKSVESLTKKNLVHYVAVKADVKDGYNTTLLSRKLQKKLDKYELPAGYNIDMGGETESTNEMVKNMLLMITLAIVFIYLIMVAQFQSMLSPFIVIFTIPLAFTGGLLALMISGQELSMMALMGFLVLSGVVVNNGIVFVDYVNQLRMDGMDKRQALIETGVTRMRPILMTALTTILAMSTMVFSHDTGSDMSRGMAIVTIGGLAYATLMTLFVVPALYDIFYRRKEMKRVDLGDETTLSDSNE